MKKKIKLLLVSLLLSLKTMEISNAQETNTKNGDFFLNQKIQENPFTIYITDDQLNICGDFRAFNNSYIKINSDQNTDMRITGSTALLGIVTLNSTATNVLNNALNLVIDSTTGRIGVGAPRETTSAGIITFSSGNVLSGSSVLPTTPRLLGFGNNTQVTVDGSGVSTIPSEVGGYSFPIPFNGTLSNLQVSTDLYAISSTLLNSTGLQYNFTILASPSTPNNGTDHVSSTYATKTLTASTAFGNLAGTSIASSTFRSATNINTGSISVSAGDRIALRVQMVTTGNSITDALIAAQVTQLSFAASFSYIPN